MAIGKFIREKILGQRPRKPGLSGIQARNRRVRDDKAAATSEIEDLATDPRFGISGRELFDFQNKRFGGRADAFDRLELREGRQGIVRDTGSVRSEGEAFGKKLSLIGTEAGIAARKGQASRRTREEEEKRKRTQKAFGNILTSKNSSPSLIG